MTITTSSHVINTHSNARSLGETITLIGDSALRYSVVVILFWIGAMKFTAYEANAIQGLVASSPFTSWLYSIFSVEGAANLIGSVEIVTAAAILFASLHRNIAIVGSLTAILTFATTSSFLLSAPVWEASLGGFPALNVVPGQFLIKDLVLLAVAISLLGKALSTKVSE